jgi:glutamate/tyrosine decarboxylase-like PLP-dependent enzyme
MAGHNKIRSRDRGDDWWGIGIGCGWYGFTWRTESILLAMKTYRDRAFGKKGVTKPEMIVPIPAHAAFDKASQYLKIKTIHIPLDENFRANVNADR